jgi:hypothetical protein
MSENVTSPANQANLYTGHILIQVKRSGNSLPYYWAQNGPTLFIKENFSPYSLVGTSLPGTMTSSGNGEFVWDFDASGLVNASNGLGAGSYVIETLDPIYKMLPPPQGIDPGYNCPPANGYTALSYFNLNSTPANPGDIPTERALASQSLKQMCLRDQARTQSETSPLSGNQSWSVPITSWDYHGATFGMALTYNSVSTVDPATVDDGTPAPHPPLTPDYAGLSEKNDKWSQPYCQWIEVIHDETGAEYALWHHGSGSLPFAKNGSAFSSPDSYHTLTSAGSVTSSYPCSGGTASITIPYGSFTITDGAGTQYFFNQPQP